MTNRNDKKNSIAKLLNQKVVTVGCVIFLILISVPLVKNISRRNQVQSEINSLKTEINKTEKNNSNLQNLLKYIDSPQFIEEQARMNLGLKKEGEEVIVVRGQPNSQAQNIIDKNFFNIPSLSNNNQVSSVGNPQKWEKYFLN